MVNRVGVPSSEHVKSDEELFAYLLKVLTDFDSISRHQAVPSHRSKHCLRESVNCCEAMEITADVHDQNLTNNQSSVDIQL